MLHLDTTHNWIPQILRIRKFSPKGVGGERRGPLLVLPFLAPHLGVVLIEHDDNLGHIVEL